MSESEQHLSWIQRTVGLAAIAAGGTLVVVLGWSLERAQSPSTVSIEPAAAALDALSYSIRTQYNDGKGGGCAGERIVPATIGLPKLVDVGGSALKDVTVTVVAVPAVGGGPDVLEVVVARVPLGESRALVEVILAPDKSAPGRVAAGPDGCETGLPGTFSATVTSSETKLRVLATTLLPTSTLSVLGSKFDAVGATRANATTVSARLAPVPALVNAVVDTTGPQSYHAHVGSNIATNLRLNYSSTKGAARTMAVATVEKFPGDLDLTFTKEKIAYTANARMDKVGLELEQVAPGERTSKMNVDLLDVPVTATLLRPATTALNPNPTRLTFTAPTRIGSAVMTFADFVPTPGFTVPVLTPAQDQYLVTRVEPNFTVATARVLGLSKADIDAGDPVLVDVAHTSGPFHVVADLVDTDASSKHLTVDALDLPATAKVTYSPIHQDFTYTGSADIAELRADVVSSVPFAGPANTSHLRILSLPTGLTGQLDTASKTFTAKVTPPVTVPGTPPKVAAIGTLEVQVTSGPNVRLPDGIQGLRLVDHPAISATSTTDAVPARYEAFVRVLGLENATVGWGETKKADFTHTAGRFEMHVDVDNIDTNGTDLDVNGVIQDLPHTALVSYGPVVPQDPTPVDPLLPPVQVGDVDQQQPGEGPTRSSFVYRGSDVVNAVDFDVVSSNPLFGRATEAHLGLTGLPKRLTVTMYHNIKHVDVLAESSPGVEAHLGKLYLEVCAPGDCDQAPSHDASGEILLPQRDGLRVDELSEHYQAKLAITGLSVLGLDWGDRVGVRLGHDNRPFDIVLNQDKPRPTTARSALRTTLDTPPNPGGCTGGGICEPPPIGPCSNWRVCDPGEEPTPQVTYYTTHTDVTIDDLPARAAVTYTPADQHVTYHGSDDIGKVEANSWTNGAPIVGRATRAHLKVEGLPQSLDLKFQYGTAEKMIVDAGTASVGHLALELTSDPGFMTNPEYAGQLIVTGAKDGLLFVDLDDEEAPTYEPVDDMFAIVVRVTNLQRFVSEVTDVPATDGTVTDRKYELTRKGTGNPGIFVHLKKFNPVGASHLVSFPGYTRYFKYDYALLRYDTPPGHFGFWFRQVDSPALQASEIKYYASQSAGPIDFRTDFGASLEGLKVELDKTPAGGGTLASPGIDACFSTSMWCNYPEVRHEEVTGATKGEVTLDLKTTQPLNVQVAARTTGDEDKFIDVALNVESELFVSKEVIPGDIPLIDADDNTYLYFDTNGHPVDGTFKVFEEDDRDMSIVIPKGFRAYQRFVEVWLATFDSAGEGQIACPGGFNIVEDWGVNLENRICSLALINNVTTTTGAAPVVTGPGSYRFVMTGTNFVPEVDYVPGTVVSFLKENDAHEWVYDPTFVAVGTKWNSVDEMEVLVKVADGAEPGPRQVRVENPIGDSRAIWSGTIAFD